jgi:hypothetical protein
MKLEIELIREILLALENYSDGHKNYDVELLYRNYPNLNKWPYLTVEYHIRQLADGGYIYTTEDYNIGYIIDLTWKGHEFLADIRPQTTWERLKGVMTYPASVSLEALKAVASTMVQEALNRKLGLHP